MFAEQLGSTMEVYIDDMLVKSQRTEDHIGHLRTCFDSLNEHDMKLNPTKCTFAVTSGEFLGYIVTKRGIEANPKKIAAVLELPCSEATKVSNEAFQELKLYLSTPPVPRKPEPGVTLYLYISVSRSAVSGVLIREDRGDQKPMFPTNKTDQPSAPRH
ncbi:unnamed protein product [Microthlaspi erraticum]|uniref:Reverse transcriptase domain-containing protein n=1 Tax=Microthlaspi erraticum TaxID=1685480 RepID=A0A6D2HUA1_9BRAS|nr:unnamed protein product [Microthlaspi erraticum]